MKNCFLFVTANSNEREAFEHVFKTDKKEYIKGKSYKIGKFGLYNAAYIHIDEQGIANPASVPIVGELIRIIEPVGIVMVGIAFGVDEHTQKIGDVLVSKKILFYDSEKIKQDGNEYKEDAKEVGFQLFNAFCDDEDWIYYINKDEFSKVHKGAMLTGSKLINNRDFRDKLLNDFAKYLPIGGEMEAFGIYSVCRLHGITEWIIVKGICDWAFDKENKKEDNQKLAAKVAVDYCYHVFSHKGIFDSLIKPPQVFKEIIEAKGFSWLHLSDLHFGSNHINNNMYDSLLKDIATLHEKNAIKLVLITGDIVCQGQSDQYNQASMFIKNLASIIGVTTDFIFCIPGNHDVIRTGLDNSLINCLKSSDDVDKFIDSKYLDLFVTKLDNYKLFIQNNFAWANEINPTTLFFTKNILIDNVRLAIIGINSAWAENIYEGSVTIGENQLLEAFSKVDNAEITIALMHHPLSHVRKFENENISKLLSSRCDFVLFGHSHERIRMISPYNELYYISAGTTFEDDKEVSSYNLVTINVNGDSFVKFRKYNEKYGLWEYDKFNGIDGRISINLPLRLTEKGLEEFFEKKEIQYRIDKSRHTGLFGIDSELKVPKPPEYLINAIKNNDCILFAGAGSSLDAKLPSWAELVYGLVTHVQEIDSDKQNNADEIETLLNNKEFIILADYCKKELGDFDFVNYIKNKLSVNDKTSLTHGLLAKIPFKAAITTNFDSFIERNRNNSEVVFPNDFENSNVTSLNSMINFPVFKIHGSYDKADSIILTKSDFRNILFKKPNYRRHLKQLFLDNLVFFYGYSFTDPDIDFLLQEIMADYNGKARKHYALLPDVKNIQKEYLQNEYNIRVISYETINNSHIAANEFLKKIIESI